MYLIINKKSTPWPESRLVHIRVDTIGGLMILITARGHFHWCVGSYSTRQLVRTTFHWNAGGCRWDTACKGVMYTHMYRTEQHMLMCTEWHS